MENKKVIILAGGLGTRLYKYTNGLYPKIMLSLGNELFIDKLINYWFDVMNVSEMSIVVSNNSSKSILDAYLNGIHRNIQVFVYEPTDGTYNTLKYINLMYGIVSNTYISWSDIIPLEKLEEPSKSFNDVTTIYTDVNKIHRYEIVSRREGQDINLTNNMSGNIPGIYYVNDIFNKFNYTCSKDETDLIEFIKYVNMSTHFETKILDIGDINKYEYFLNQNSIDSRYFNDIQFNSGIVTKKSVNEYGQKIMDLEIDYLKKAIENGYGPIYPTFYELSDKIVMEDLTVQGYTTVANHIINNKPNIDNLINDYLNFRNNLPAIKHNLSDAEIKKACHSEYVKVTANRYGKISYLIPKYNEILINDRLFVLNNDFYKTINKIENFVNTYKPEFGFVHGDPNTSNVFYNGSDFKYIDPRGVFGDIKYFGDLNYDTAKFIYGISGYNTFNLDKFFTFDVVKNSIRINLEELEILFENENISNDIKILIGIIWLKLPFYIKNNPNKAIASYYIGMCILNKYL